MNGEHGNNGQLALDHVTVLPTPRPGQELRVHRQLMAEVLAVAVQQKNNPATMNVLVRIYTVTISLPTKFIIWGCEDTLMFYI